MSKDEIIEYAFEAADYYESISVVYKTAMDEYAKQQAIQFAKWLNKEGWEEYDESDRWICPSNNRNVYTTEQLYKKFTQ